MSSLDESRREEIEQAIAKVRRLEEAVELGWWDDWSVTLADAVEEFTRLLREKDERLKGLTEEHRDLAHRVQRVVEQAPPEWDGGDLGYLIGDLGDPVLEAEAGIRRALEEKP